MPFSPFREHLNSIPSFEKFYSEASRTLLEKGLIINEKVVDLSLDFRDEEFKRGT